MIIATSSFSKTPVSIPMKTKSRGFRIPPVSEDFSNFSGVKWTLLKQTLFKSRSEPVKSCDAETP